MAREDNGFAMTVSWNGNVAVMYNSFGVVKQASAETVPFTHLWGHKSIQFCSLCLKEIPDSITASAPCS